MSSDSPPQRKDAARNRERIIEAARELFSREGFDVSFDAIAQGAGVGRATLYRNFADKYALGAAIFDDNITALEALARREPRPTFMALLEAVIEQQVQCHALVPALLSARGATDMDSLGQRMNALLEGPLERARCAGEVRDDLQTMDVLGVLAMISAVMIPTATAQRRRARAQRALELVFDGLRARPR
ncbi:MAG: TetR/AcrR family transcriptional regulator [Myxococcales bacterium]|nr:TetR/AcrR family transcriptional regulator [Myxococcales bacterium]